MFLGCSHTAASPTTWGSPQRPLQSPRPAPSPAARPAQRNSAFNYEEMHRYRAYNTIKAFTVSRKRSPTFSSFISWFIIYNYYNPWHKHYLEIRQLKLIFPTSTLHVPALPGKPDKIQSTSFHSFNKTFAVAGWRVWNSLPTSLLQTM